MATTDYTRARRHLARRDPVLRDLMRAHGKCGLAEAQNADPFGALLKAIVSQQLSTKAAKTIYTRLMALFDGVPTPQGLARLADDELRAAGLSGQKLRYMRDLGARVHDGSLPLHALDAMGDEDVIVALTQVKGIGRWTAEMYLMFRLHRPDVLPAGDLGIVKAVQKAYGLSKTPSPDRLHEIGEAWRPYRSVACWYLWRSLNNTPASD
ncbi:MAG TPA: DNA-3-methyladenine glycosylase [Vicinamibacterales bacterium]|nr:DNA-3-methyladenine glycosylase [Vicinamibacterales bacterium]